MIVFEASKLLIITPPHTASGYLHQFYCGKGAYYCVGPNPDQIIDHHNTVPHNAWADFTKILVVRRPFERLVGLYEHHVWWSQQQGLPLITWPQFVYAVISKDKNLPWLYRFTISQLLDYDRVKPDIIWQYERLNEPPVILEKPNFNPPHKDYSQYSPLKSVVDIWGQEDLKFYD